MSEFNLIRRHFTRSTPNAVLGVGDDAALLQVSAGQVLAVSSDMLVSGTHFFADADPYLLGHKTLAVNLSDMAAMGAVPRWATLALALPYKNLPHPNPDETTKQSTKPASGQVAAYLPLGEGMVVNDAWLTQFSAGFFALADAHGVTLVGGDTTRGALNLCVTIMGEVPLNGALRRDGAQVGDDIWVSGTLGDAALGLAHLQGKIELPEDARVHCLARLHQPNPRVALGLALRGVASSAIDISDGLLADLGHVLDASGVGAEIEFARLPVAEVLRDLSADYALAGGDDYELCFTAAPLQRETIAKIATQLNLPLSRIGRVLAGDVCVVKDAAGAAMQFEKGGYDHFA